MKHSQKNTAFYIEILALLLMLIFGMTVVIQMFGYSKNMSFEAKKLSRAVPIAYNAVEGFIARDELEAIEYYYDRDWNECEKQNGFYTVKLSVHMEEENSGQMRDVMVTVEGKDEVIYELQTRKYLPEQ